MNILRVVPSMNPQYGGVVEAINQLAKELNKNPWKMDVLCFDAADAIWVCETNDYSIHAIGVGKTAYSINPKYFSWLWRNAKSYDVVILDGLWQFHVLGGYLLKLMNVPYCVFVHGMLDPYFNKDKLKYVKKLPFWFLIERNVISMAHSVVFTSKEEKYLASQSFPFYRANPTICTLSVSATKTSPAYLKRMFYEHYPQLEGKRFALFLSRINQIKGVDLLIEALGKLSVLPDDFLLIIAGPDYSGLQDKLVKRSEELGISDRVIWVGMLRGDMKWGAYYSSEIFILPSHHESFGIVVAEALSTGTPVLITDKINIWREIVAEKAGLVETDSVEGIQTLLEQWFTLSDEKKESMCTSANRCYSHHFPIDAAVSELETILLGINNKHLDSGAGMMEVKIKNNLHSPVFDLRNKLTRVFWAVIYLTSFRLSPVPLFGVRRWILRAFGARIEDGANIYPSVKIWLPSNLEVGFGATLGPNVIVYNQGKIKVGRNTIVSQGVHLCASTHDYNDPLHSLILAPITIESNAWVCADAFVGPNVTIFEGAVLGARAVLTKDADAWCVYAGNPACKIKQRVKIETR